MTQYIRPTRTIHAVLIVAVAVTIGAGAPGPAHAATEKVPRLVQAGEKANETLQQADHEKDRRRIRQENDKQLKMQEPLYSRQAGSLAKRYKETAAIVTRQGGDPKPLLDAAAYFERQSE
ncbi:MAG: hypothetical protein ACREUR_08905 [Nitrosospira sp.]